LANAPVITNIVEKNSTKPRRSEFKNTDEVDIQENVFIQKRKFLIGKVKIKQPTIICPTSITKAFGVIYSTKNHKKPVAVKIKPSGKLSNYRAFKVLLKIAIG
jgi:hypothetical protein